MWPRAWAARASPVPTRSDLVTRARVTERVAKPARIVVTRTASPIDATSPLHGGAPRSSAPAGAHRLTMP